MNVNIYISGAVVGQTTLEALQGFSVGQQFVTIDDASTSYQMLPGETGLVNRKTAPGALAVSLPETPTTGDIVIVGDDTGDISTFPMSVEAPNGGTINGATGALVYSANYESTRFWAITTTSWLILP